jgi:transposase
MRFYTQQHRFCCGIDLHARSMHLCILDQAGKVVFDKNLPSRPEALLRAVEPFRDGLVVGVECMFAWYWVADCCQQHDIAFVLGHALYMKAIHGGKAKNDRIDAGKIARLLKGGNPARLRLPQGHARDARPAAPPDLPGPQTSRAAHPPANPQRPV